MYPILVTGLARYSACGYFHKVILACTNCPVNLSQALAGEKRSQMVSSVRADNRQSGGSWTISSSTSWILDHNTPS